MIESHLTQKSQKHTAWRVARMLRWRSFCHPWDQGGKRKSSQPDPGSYVLPVVSISDFSSAQMGRLCAGSGGSLAPWYVGKFTSLQFFRVWHVWKLICFWAVWTTWSTWKFRSTKYTMFPAVQSSPSRVSSRTWQLILIPSYSFIFHPGVR